MKTRHSIKLFGMLFALIIQLNLSAQALVKVAPEKIQMSAEFQDYVDNNKVSGSVVMGNNASGLINRATTTPATRKLLSPSYLN